MKAILMTIALTLLAGCTTPEQPQKLPPVEFSQQ